MPVRYSVIAALVISFVLFQNFTSVSATQPEVVFRLPEGRQLNIRGRQIQISGKSLEAAGVHLPVDQFLGIPYARKPIGIRRWTDTGVLPIQDLKKGAPGSTAPVIFDAATLADACPQEALESLEALPNIIDLVNNMSEDCLYLNLWRPSYLAKTSTKLPVLVWIHGGGFVRNSIRHPKTFGEIIASHNAVVVSVDYRIGALGFFGFPGLNEEQAAQNQLTGNYGLIDVVNSLKWVKENISQFGGDPNNVTIFGTSAGGATVNTLMTSEYIKNLETPLFHKAISQSGGGVGEKSPLLAVDETRGSIGKSAQSFGLNLWQEILRDNINCHPDPKSPLFEALDGKTLLEARAIINETFPNSTDINLFRICVSHEEILKRTGLQREGGEYRNYPFVDGRLLSTNKVLDAFAQGQTLPIPYINGSAADESSLIRLQGRSLEKSRCEISYKAPKFFRDGRPVVTFQEKVLAIAELYSVQVSDIDTFIQGGLDSEYDQAMRKFYSDMHFAMPAQMISHYQNRSLSTKAPGLNAYSYEYAYLPTHYRQALARRFPDVSNSEWSYMMSAAGHSQEAFPLFGKIKELLQSDTLVSSQDMKVSKFLISRWVNFARTGHPSSGSDLDVNLWAPNSNASTVFTAKSGVDRQTSRMFITLASYPNFKKRVVDHFAEVLREPDLYKVPRGACE